MVITGLFIVLLMVLVIPFISKRVEENLEPFLFVMGVAASIISGIMSYELVLKALEEPLMITLAVLVAGAGFFVLNKPFQNFINKILTKVNISVLVAVIIIVLGLLSSIITAIVASIILVEIIYLLPIKRKQKIVVCILSCFSIGTGAALTPIGEPLATIAISKLDEGFFYLFHLLSIYVIPAIIGFGILGSVYLLYCGHKNGNNNGMDIDDDDVILEPDNIRTIIIRALKVYLFVMALVFLGEGFYPLIDKYVLGLTPQLLYWVNMVSAVLDNATLTAAEISRQMSDEQVKAIIMGLLFSGGMLIPGNIPNIISASKLKISSKEWALWGVPLGLITMGMYYIILFWTV